MAGAGGKEGCAGPDGWVLAAGYVQEGVGTQAQQSKVSLRVEGVLVASVSMGKGAVRTGDGRWGSGYFPLRRKEEEQVPVLGGD